MPRAQLTMAVRVMLGSATELKCLPYTVTSVPPLYEITHTVCPKV